MLTNPEGDSTPHGSAVVLIPGLPHPLTYSIPPQLVSSIETGSQVVVPLGSRKVNGWVIECSTLSDNYENNDRFLLQSRGEAKPRAYKLKPIQAAMRAFPSSQLRLFSWFSEYYCCSLTEAIENAIPTVSGQAKRKNTDESNTDQTFTSERTGDLAAHTPTLTQHQENAVNKLSAAIEQSNFLPHLLFGVTGSGKTEVYIRCINKVLEMGKTALIIVPEIALTPQLYRNFSERISEPIAILHSQLAKGQRWKSWQDLLSGKVRVAIGARSAVFAPLSNLGIVIVDEEHESSYKQSDGLRYSARDTAIVRAKMSSCPIVLGSATPSFESLINAKRGKYEIIELPERVTKRPLPLIEIVDLTRIKTREMASPNISPQLYHALEETFAKGEQAVILYNRRGFSSFLQCNTCGDVVQCPHCAVSLTFHKKKSVLVCHYCDYSTPPMPFCPTCRDPRTTCVTSEKETSRVGEIVHRGGGTERIEEEILEAFPTLRIARMDRDTVTQKDSHTKILDAMRHGKADLLLGTQMIAKGHDLPRVTLVGVIDADVGLHFPDFRANERVFQLITQAAGRAGRADLPGRVLVQTRQANHPAIVAIATGRFKAFARYELEFRDRLKYPPYAKLMRIIVSCTDSELARRSAEYVTQILRPMLARAHNSAETATSFFADILGPTPAPIEKIRGRYRYHLIVKSSSSKLLSLLGQKIMDARREHFKKDEVRVTIDVDPLDML